MKLICCLLLIVCSYHVCGQQQQLVGGVTPINVHDEDVQLFLKEALVDINAGEEPDYV